MKIIFDFDDTIFDTNRFKQEKLFPCLLRYGITTLDFSRNYEQYRKDNPVYDIKEHLTKIAGQYNISIDINDIVQGMIKNLDEFIFPEYLNVIKKYGRENIFILTQGDNNFQRLKITKSKIDKKVEEIFTVEGTKAEKVKSLCTLWNNDAVLFFDNTLGNLDFEMSDHNLVRVFVGNVNDLTEKQLKKLNWLGIKTCNKAEVTEKIPKYVSEMTHENNEYSRAFGRIT
jgi:FMN phosphatase YigB (HAD superfamily)